MSKTTKKHRTLVCLSVVSGIIATLAILSLVELLARLTATNTGNKFYDSGYEYMDSEVGGRPTPGKKSKSRHMLGDNTVAFDVEYSIDSNGRRFTPGQDDANRLNTMLFLGCSFVYGEGLSDDETLPAQTARFQDLFRVYNLSFHGWGPNNLLRLVRHNEFGKDLSKGQAVKAIYVFIDDHINRVIGSLSVYQVHQGWATKLPYYFLDSEGRLQTRGMISQSLPFMNLLNRGLAKSTFLKRANFSWPPQLDSDRNLRLTTAIIEDLRATINSKLGKTEFYVLFFPGAKIADALIPYLKEKEIEFLDYSGLNLSEQVEGRIRLEDGHPSAATNRFLARRILKDLGVIN